MALLRPRWSTDPPEDEAVVLPRGEYQLLLAEHAHRVAGEWAGALRRGDEGDAARCVAQLRALASAGGASTLDGLSLDPALRAVRAGPGAGPRLFTGDSPSLWDGLRSVGHGARQVDIVVAYAQPGGVRLLAEWFDAERAAAAPRRVRLLVGTYLNGTSVDALHQLLALARRTPDLAVRLLTNPAVHFHPKVYRVVDARGRCHLFVGSSNLSRGALRGGSRDRPVYEWNLGLDEDSAPAVVQAATARLEHLLTTCGVALTEDVIEAYDVQRRAALPPAALFEEDTPAVVLREERPAQTEALAALASLRAQGFRRALVVAATGLGKTVLAALDSMAAAPEGRVLFLAHRETLLTQARDAFAEWRPGELGGLVHGEARETGARHLFVSVASAHHVDPGAFDYVVVDEAHHGTAKTYRDVFDRLRPSAFVLGLTATPQRLDGGDIYGLFDDVVAYEVGLIDAIGRRWLVPFHYFGLRDTLDFSARALRDFSPAKLEREVLGDGRMARVTAALLDEASYPGTKTLAFCASIEHAQRVAERLQRAGVAAAAVHSGPSSLDAATAIDRLRAGTLRALCVVDMFNEGVDVPEVDRVAFLRPTDSPVVFLQQLGRGLRLAAGKTALVVVDFVANHRRAELRPEWLGVSPDAVAGAPAGKAYAHRFDDGRAVFFEPAAVDAIRALRQRQPSVREQVRDAFDRLRAEAPDAQRPTYRALLARAGRPQVTVRSLLGSWLDLLADRGAMTPGDVALAGSEATRGLLDVIESTRMTGPHKMLLLVALAASGRPRCTLTEAAGLVRDLIERRHPALLASPAIARDKLDRPKGLRKLLRDMPVQKLLESAPSCFHYDREADVFEIVMPEDLPVADVLAAIEERAEARLFDHLRRRTNDAP